MKLKHRLFSLLLALAMTFTMASAAFENVRGYGGFSDVKGGWSQPYIQQCYEMGLMDGVGGGRFDPAGTLTLAQVVTVAVRLADLYRGGDGVIGQSGAHWYDEAVERALEEDILSPGQFDRYDRLATRAEVAGLLAAALPGSEYRAINKISALPDVDKSTPYADAIFTLYNAGILTGGDAYGTYSPNAPLTREALSAILCRLCKPETRVELALAPKPRELTVKTADKKLVLAGIPVYGLLEIDGEFYVPLALFSGNASALGKYSDYSLDYNGEIYFSRPIGYSWSESVAVPDYTLPAPGTVLGTAQPTLTMRSPKSYYDTVTLMTLDGYFPMVRVEDLADKVRVQGDTLCADLDGTPYAPQMERDLAGQALSGLLGATPRDTVKNIHDYIVNALTYEPYTDASAAAMQQAAAQYGASTNRTLAGGYGVCEDYADLFLTMCLQAGIPCERVTGTATEGHAWNRVYVDGKWSFVDCTWDDPASRKPVLRYDYFLKDADTMAKTHFWRDSDYPMPTTYDPAWAELDCNNITSTDMFRKCLIAQMMQGKATIRLRTTVNGAYGGLGCVYGFNEVSWEQISGGYNKSSGCYVYTVDYGW